MHRNETTEIERLSRRLRVLEAVQHAMLEVAEVPQFHARLQRMADVARALTKARLAALAVFDQAGRVQEFLTSGIGADVRHLIGAFPTGTGMFGALFREGRALRLKDVRSYPSAGGFPAHHPPIHSFLGVAVTRQTRVLGAFYLANREAAEEFSDEDQEVLENFAKHVAFEIDLNPWVRGS